MILAKQKQTLTTPLKWRTRDGELIAPKEMENRHLFYTLRMIWNHSVPEHLQIGENIKRYVFDPDIYTADYMRLAVAAIALELSNREDVGESWRPELNQMIRYMQQRRLEDVRGY